MARRNVSSLLLTVAPLLTLGSWSLWSHRVPVQPTVTATRQITHDGLVKTNLASDGVNLYFTELSGANAVIAKVPATGGDISKFPVNFENSQLLDVSAKHSSLLAAEYGSGKESPFWMYPLNGGAAKRLGVLSGQEAVWAPDGQHVLLVRGSSLFVADANGTSAKEIATVNGTPYYPRYSPDGKRIRFSVGDLSFNTSALWELNSDGTGLHEVLSDWHDVSSKCCGTWTPNGRYYIFQATEANLGNTNDLFALAEGNASSARPVKLTEGSISFTRPVSATDNKRIWAMGLNVRGSVVSYEAASKRYVPFLSGISATDLAFSADGEWVAYVSVPEGMLWRCKRDGSHRQQLTFVGRAALPQWSPDGKGIAYVNVQEGAPWAIFIVSSQGGEPRAVLREQRTQIDINWSHDGNSIIFGRIRENNFQGLSIVSFDLRTHTLSNVPGSDGLFSPRVSPDGRYIAALTADMTKLMLYDAQSQKWSQWQTLESGSLNYPVWSPDSKSIYFDNLVSGEGAYCRAKVGENHFETVFSQGGIERHLGPFGLWSGRAPDGSVLFVQEASTREIYELQVDLP